MPLGQLSVCLSVRTRNSKTTAPIDSSFVTRELREALSLWLGASLRQSGSGLKNLFKDSSPLGDRTNMPSKYATTSNMRYNGKMRYDITYSSLRTKVCHI